jgi:hypothetical protein
MKASRQIEVSETTQGSASGHSDTGIEEVISSIDASPDILRGISHPETDFKVRRRSRGNSCFGSRLTGQGESREESRTSKDGGLDQGISFHNSGDTT